MADNGNGEERDLKGVYGAVQSGIWLIGLAILAWQGAWWPGILILVAISGITQAVLQSMAKRQESVAQTAGAARAAAMAVPPNCPTCGAAINASSVVWSGPTAAQCPYCKSAIPLKRDATTAKEQKS
jgi:predicted Zn-ribbon and HTH transcriptional regulator